MLTLWLFVVASLHTFSVQGASNGAVQKTHQHTVFTPGEYEITVEGVPALANQSLTIENLGPARVEGIKVLTDHTTDTTTVKAILQCVLNGVETDRDKALALWQFIQDYSYSWQTAKEGIEPFDPVRLVNVYGYGLCDTSANSLALLWEASGGVARVWYLTGHVVPELYYDGAWHLLDPDHRVYYLKDDNRTIASVEEVATSPTLILRMTDEKGRDPAGYRAESIARLYTTQDDNTVFRPLGHINNTALLNLHSGERLVRYAGRKMGYFSKFPGKEPRSYSNAELIFEPNLRTYFWQNNFWAHRGLALTTDDSIESPALHLAEGKSKGECIVHIESPFVIVRSSLRLTVVKQSEESSCRVLIGFPGRERWDEVFSAPERGIVEYRLDLSSAIAGRYEFFLKFELAGGSSTDIGIDALGLHSIVQCSPKTFPTLQRGKNAVRISYETPQIQAKPMLRITYAWDEKRE
jgi:hypothetical protein